VRLAVSEVFGPTIQGEGPDCGVPAVFLRTMACNLSCRWCDTPYTWDGKRFNLAAERQLLTPHQAALRIRKHANAGTHLVVVSGGEPMLQQPALLATLRQLPASCRVQVETAGTIAPRDLADFDAGRLSYVVSLKLAHSGNAGGRYVPDAINALRDSGQVAAWKFVLATDSDYREVDWLVEQHQLAPVWVMAEGTEAWRLAHRMEQLLPGAIERGYRVTPRLHIDIFGNRRAV